MSQVLDSKGKKGGGGVAGWGREEASQLQEMRRSAYLPLKAVWGLLRKELLYL